LSRLRSLRGRLLLASGAGIAVASLAAAWLLGAVFERAAMGAFERRLADDLVTVIGVVARDGGGGVRLRREPADGRYTRVFSGHYWQVGVGEAALRSRSLWDFEPPRPAATDAAAVTFSDLEGPQGQRLRSASRDIRLPGLGAPVRVWVASDQAILRAEVDEFRWLAGVSFAVLAAALILAAAAQVRYGLRPLRGIADTLASVRRGDSRRLDRDGLPTEVQPLAEHINELLDHHERMVNRARTAAQDLAHALKTPLAVLDAESQAAGVSLPGTVRDQVARMRGVVDRHLVTGAPADTRQSTVLASVLGNLMALMASAHRERALVMVDRSPPGLLFRGAGDDLEEMLGNLLDNACKWARSSVQVDAGMISGRLWIEVRDDGPGLPEAQRGTVLGRGVRMDERVPGSGLGLAIVHDIAASYGGTLVLADAPEGGLSARLELPAA
jgi:signal transduction histidine kinase